MVAGSGEAVDSNVIADFNKRDDASLIRMRGQGLSDQKVALINTILARRASGSPNLNPRDSKVLKQFSESRSVADVQETIARRNTAQQASSKASEKINVPIRYGNEEIFNLYNKYQKGLTDKQRRLSQYEQNQIITSNPNYKAEIGKVLDKVSTEEFQQFAERQGYTRPEQYGRPSEASLTPLGKQREQERQQRDVEEIARESKISPVKTDSSGAFYYKSLSQFSGEDRGIKYYQTDAEGNIIKKFTKAE